MEPSTSVIAPCRRANSLACGGLPARYCHPTGVLQTSLQVPGEVVRCIAAAEERRGAGGAGDGGICADPVRAGE